MNIQLKVVLNLKTEKMMFRAWDKINRIMYSDGIFIELDGFIMEDAEQINDTPNREIQKVNAQKDYAILEYIQLKDIKGKYYCQDDLVKINDSIHRLIKGTYKFELVGFYNSSQDDPTCFFSEMAFSLGEIVGNIYENPELIKIS